MPTTTTNSTRIAQRAGVSARLSARLRSGRLDEALAGGTSPETTASLALRARRLATLSCRREIAESLLRVTRGAARGVQPSLSRISPRRAQVSAAADELTRLAEALATPGPVSARGVAQALILLTDGTGPMYNGSSTANLRARAAVAAGNLHLAD